jgi:hypothetical protein
VSQNENQRQVPIQEGQTIPTMQQVGVAKIEKGQPIPTMQVKPTPINTGNTGSGNTGDSAKK